MEKDFLKRVFASDFKKQDQKRFRLLEAAVQVFADLGLEKVTLASVGEKVRMSASHVAYYFPSKDELAKAVIKYVCFKTQENVLAKVKVTENPSKIIRLLFSEALALAEKRAPEIIIGQMFFYLASYRTEYRDLATELRATSFQRIEGIIRPYLETKSIPDKDITRRARAIYHLFGGIFTDMVETNTHLGRARELKDLMYYVEKILADDA